LGEKSSHQSPNRLAIERFKKNKPAVIGALVIVLCVFVAVFAYQIVTDSSPNANRQISEINLAEIGQEVQLLKVKSNFAVQKKSALSRFFLGSEDSHTYIPYDVYKIKNDSILLFRNDALYKEFHLLDVVYPLANTPKINTHDSNFRFIDTDGLPQSTSQSELLAAVKNTHLLHRRFWLGTDQYGRDVLSRLIIGVRISLLAGLIAVVISIFIGTLLGMLAGYFGGRIDTIISFLINTVWSIPTLLLVFAIVIAMGKSIFNIFLAVGLTMWVDVARIVRGQVLTLKNAPYIEAMKVMGTPLSRIMFRHLLPNLIGPLLVIAAANFATAILLEAGLSYLGFGIQPPTPSWGTMLNEHYGFAIGGRPILALIPALAILILVLSFNLVGNGLRDALDVKSEN
jgi:peptide/nickel transport system permease protein